MATGSQLSSLYVRIGADTTGLEQGLSRAKSRLGQFEGVARVAVASMTAVAVGAAAAGAAVVAMVSSAARGAREISTLAQVANTTAQDFQGLAYAAKSVGIEQQKFADILKDVNDRVGDFRATGGGAMKDFFEQIAPKVGLTAEAFRDLSGPQALQLYYDSLVKAGAAQDDLTFYMEQMASDATSLIPLLENGGEGFRRLAEQAQALGMVLSDVERESLLQFDQAMSAIGGTIDGLKNQLAASLAPALTQVAGRFLNFVVEVRKGESAIDDVSGAAVELGTSTELQDWIYAVGIGIARLADALVGIGKTISAIHSSFKVVAADIQSLLGSFAEDKSGISDWINPDEAEKRRKELETVLNKRNRTLEEANAKWADLWNYKGNRFEEAWQNAFNSPVDLPPVTVFGRSGGGGGLTGGSGDSEAAQKERENYIRQLQDKLELLREHVASATELEIRAHLERQEQLRELYEQGLVTDEERKALALELEQKHQEDLTAIAARGEEERSRNIQKWAQTELQMRGDVVRQGIALLDQFAGKSKAAAIAAIALSKGLAIAETIIWTQAAAMRALAELGPIAGPPVAAAIEGMGAAKVGLIAATGLAQAAGALGGGGSGNMKGGASGSIGGNSSAPSSPSGSGSGPQSVVTINLQGDRFGQKEVRDLIEQINEAVGDGARLRVA